MRRRSTWPRDSISAITGPRELRREPSLMFRRRSARQENYPFFGFRIPRQMSWATNATPNTNTARVTHGHGS